MSHTRHPFRLTVSGVGHRFTWAFARASCYGSRRLGANRVGEGRNASVPNRVGSAQLLCADCSLPIELGRSSPAPLSDDHGSGENGKRGRRARKEDVQPRPRVAVSACGREFARGRQGKRRGPLHRIVRDREAHIRAACISCIATPTREHDLDVSNPALRDLPPSPRAWPQGPWSDRIGARFFKAVRRAINPPARSRLTRTASAPASLTAS